MPMAVYWTISFSNYHVGFVVYPLLSGLTYFYLLICSLAVLFSYYCGYKQYDGPKIAEPEQGLVLKLTPWVCVLWTAGSWGIVLDRFRSGVSIDIVLTETEVVRDEFATSILTTLCSPFAGLCFVALAMYAYHWAVRGCPKMWTNGIVAAGLAATLANSFLSTNRGSFLHLGFWMFYLLVFILGYRYRDLIMPGRLVVLKIVGLVFCVVALTYIMFISTERSSENYLRSFSEGIEPRYNLHGLFADERSEHSFLMLSSYTTGQYAYIERLLPVSDPVSFHPESVLMWYVRQVGRISPDFVNNIYYGYWDRVTSLGLDRTGWPSAVGGGLLDYGWIGLPILILFVFYWFGKMAAKFLYTGCFSALFVTFLLFNYLNNSYMGIPGSETFGVGIGFLFALPSLKNSPGVAGS